MLARGGYKWISGTLLVAALFLLFYILLYVFVLLLISVLFLICDCFFLVFFRDPKRNPGKGIVSPADGRVLFVSNSGTTRIAIFMSVTNVHVNRAPLSGRVLRMTHKPGGLLPAYKHGSKNNERLITSMQTQIGKIKVIQIAGLIARRIVPYIQPGQNLKKGQRIGIIQFGSRVDLLLPSEHIRVNIRPGQRVRAGVTSIALIT